MNELNKVVLEIFIKISFLIEINKKYRLVDNYFINLV